MIMKININLKEIKVKRTLVVLLGVLLLAVWSTTALAADSMASSEGEIVLRTLLKKGIITQAEYEEGMNEIKVVNKKQQEEHVDKHITHAEDGGPAFTNGLSIAAGVTLVGQGTSGNDDNATPGEDIIDGNISVDIEISAPMGINGEAFIALEAGDGMGVTDELTTFWGVNADAGFEDSNVALTEVWYEHRFLNDMVSFTIGKVNLTNYFDGNEVANDETTQFLSDGFVNNLAVEFPDNSVGTRVTVSPNNLIDISVGAQSGDSDWEDIFEKPFLIAEADVKPKFGELQGNYRVMTWTNRTNHTELMDSSKDEETGSGFGLSFDQQVTDSVSLFGRIGFQDKEIYEFDMAWSGGLALNGGMWGRDDDAFAVAYGQAILSDDNEDVLKADGTNPGNEGHLEAYYSLVINEHVAVSPDIQVVTNASGDEDFETVVIGGLRGQFTF